MNKIEQHNSKDITSIIIDERSVVNYIPRYVGIDGRNDNELIIGIGEFIQLKPCGNPVLEQTDKRCTSIKKD